MRPRLFPSLGLRDSGYLQTAAWTPDPADAQMWGWWSADQYVTESAGAITVWGDRTNNTVDKTDLSGTRNLLPYGTYKTSLGSASGAANLCFKSQEMLHANWTTFLVTKNSNTTFTFTGANGTINTYYPIYHVSVTYRVTATMRAVTGNTNLRFAHFGSPTGNYTNVNITGALATYSCDFLGNGGSIYVGLNDNNVAGWGQVEVTQWQITEAAWGVCPYVNNSTTDTLLYPPLGGLRCCVTNQRATSTALHYFGNESLVDLADIATSTVYMAVYIMPYSSGHGSLLCARHGPGDMNCDLNVTDFSIYINAGLPTRIDTGTAITLGNWYIFTGVWNAGSSEARHMKNAGVGGILMAIPAGHKNGFWIGGEGVNPNARRLGIYEVIVRTGVDNTATQDQYIDYLADRVGIVV